MRTMQKCLLQALHWVVFAFTFVRVVIQGQWICAGGTISFWQALWFAVQAHGKQRYGRFPYIYHLVHVVLVAIRAGVRDSVIILACLVHDVFEDTKTGRQAMLDAGFPLEVVQICEAVKNLKKGGHLEKKINTMFQILAGGPKAIIVKVCDRTANGEYGLYFGQIDGDSQYQGYREIYPVFRCILRNEKVVETNLVVRTLWNRLDDVMRYEDVNSDSASSGAVQKA